MEKSPILLVIFYFYKSKLELQTRNTMHKVNLQKLIEQFCSKNQMESQLIAFLQQADISQIDQYSSQQPRVRHSRSSGQRTNKNRLQLRMLQNKHQREIIEQQKQSYQAHLREKRRNKENQVCNRIMKTRNQRRNLHSQFIKENRKALGTEQRDRKQKVIATEGFHRDLIRQVGLDQINDKIEIRRKKVQIQRMAKMQRIHQRNQQQKQKNKRKVEEMQKIAELKSDQHHLKQWHAYERKLVQKYNRQNSFENKKSPQKTIELYERFKAKELSTKKIVNATKSQVLKGCDEQQNQDPSKNEKIKQNNKNETVNKNVGSRNEKRIRILKSQQSLAVEGLSYFGLTQDLSLKNKQNLITNLKGVIIDYRSCADVDKDENLIIKVEQFLNCL